MRVRVKCIYIHSIHVQRLSKLPGVAAGGFEPLSWQERLTVAIDIVTGLLYLHTPDPDTHKPPILHRDMKPSNILLNLDKRARLANMGLARAQRPVVTHLTTTTSIAGTIGYDNYQNGGRFDEKADGYAVGVTPLVLLTGRPAVDGGEHIIGTCDVDDVSEVVDRVYINGGFWRNSKNLKQISHRPRRNFLLPQFIKKSLTKMVSFL